MLICIFPNCNGHDDHLEAVLHGQQAIRRDLAAIKRELGIHHTEQEHHMSEIDDRIADLQAAEDTNTGKLARLITDFESKGELTDEQRAALDALKAEIVGNSDAIDAADPEATPPAEPTV